MLLFYLDAMEQAILKRQLQCPVSLSILTFPSRIEDSRSFDVNMELSLNQRPFQEVTSGSSVPSSVVMVKVERRNLLTIHIPHSRVTDHIRLKNEVLSPSARIAAADLASRSRPSPIQRQGLKGNTPRLVA